MQSESDRRRSAILISSALSIPVAGRRRHIGAARTPTTCYRCAATHSENVTALRTLPRSRASCPNHRARPRTFADCG